MVKALTFGRKLKRHTTRAEFKQRVAEIRAALKAEVRAWEGADATREAKERRLRRCEADPFEFYYTYLPHYFRSEPAPFHRELVDLIDVRGGGVIPVVVGAPRGFAKTTVVTFGYTLHQVLFRKRRFPILASDTRDLASDLTAYIYLELLENERIKADFGPQVDDNQAVDDFETKGGARVLARGRGQRVRGLKHGPYRPDLFVGDDLENDKNVKNPRLVKELLDWLTSTVYPAIDEDNGSVFVVGTLLARRSALAIMVKGAQDPFGAWTRKLYRALNPDGKGGLVSLWPDRHPVESLLRQKAMIGSLAFNKEKQNDPQDEQGAFREEWIEAHAYDPGDLPKFRRVAGFLDPSISQNENADPRAIITVGLLPDGRMAVADAYVRRDSLEQVLQHAFALHKKHGYSDFGLEDNLFQKLLLGDFDRLARQHGHMPVRGVAHTTNKQARIGVLSPLVERGILIFPKAEFRDEDMRELIEQLIYFPDASHDDGPDALEGAVALLNFGAAPNVW